MRLQFLAKYREAGLLFLRLGLGVFFVMLAAPVLFGGGSRWAQFGGGMRAIGIHSHSQAWGSAGALLVCVGAALILFGLFFRIGILICLVVAIIHAAAVIRHSGMHAALLPIELCVVLFSALLIGPGKYSVDKT